MFGWSCNAESEDRIEAPRICQIHQPFYNKHNLFTWGIQKVDMAPSRQRTPQPDRLHYGQKVKKQGHTTFRFSFLKIKDPAVAETFQAMIGGRFASLTDTDANMLIKTSNAAVTELTSKILGKHRPAKKPWITVDVLSLYDKGRELKKKKRREKKTAKQHRAVSQEIKKCMKGAKEKLIDKQWQDIEDSLKASNSKKNAQACEGPDRSQARASGPQQYRTKKKHVWQTRRTYWTGRQNISQSCITTEPQEIQEYWMSLLQPTLMTTPSSPKKLSQQWEHWRWGCHHQEWTTFQQS